MLSPIYQLIVFSEKHFSNTIVIFDVMLLLLQMITEEDLQRVITDIEREQEEAKKSAEPAEG